MFRTTNYAPGETVEILYFTDDLSSWERGWQPATYVSPYGGAPASVEAHIVNCPIGDKVVSFNEIRQVTR